MKDFNFFDPYIKVEGKSSNNRVVLIILFALLLALMTFYQLMLINKAKTLEADIAEIDTYLNSPSTTQKVSVVEAKQAELDTLRIVYTDLMVISDTIEVNDTLDDMLIEQINAQLPEGAFMSDLSSTNQVVTIKGYSLEYKNIAQFAYNLRESGLYNIMIPTITESNGNYMYTITAGITAEVTYEN